MSEFIAQLVLARRGPDDDGWMNLLFFVVVAVLYVVGAVVKAMKAKSADDRQSRKTPPRRRIVGFFDLPAACSTHLRGSSVSVLRSRESCCRDYRPPSS